MSTAIETVAHRVSTRWAPPPRLTVSAWADAERRLPVESSSEPGRWRTERAEYLRGIMDAYHDTTVETVAFQKPAQCGGTEALLNIVGYILGIDPGPVLVLLPTLELAHAYSKDRLAPMLRQTPSLRGVVGEPRAKDGTTTLLHKRARTGAVLTIAGANSPASLAMRPIRALIADDVDRYPATVGAEGDPLSLAIARTSAFRRKKVYIVSTPTVEGGSRIAEWFARSDQRIFELPCPHCGVFHALEWPNLTWTNNDPATAHFVCPHCRGRVEDRARPAMLRAGRWRATAPFVGVAGFRIWEAYAPWRSLAQIVAGFLAAKRSIETLRVWRNTSMAETWEEPGEAVPAAPLLARRETYPAELPAGVCGVTAGVDTQDDRLEVLVMGWGPGEESWIVARETLPGDPARPEVWAQLDALLQRRWHHEYGIELPIHSTCIDSAGHRTQFVYDYVRPRQGRFIRATVGRIGGSHQLVSPPKPVQPARGAGTVLLHTIDVDACKSLLYSRLRLTLSGPEFVHFPMAVDEEFFAQLTAEKLITRREQGVPVRRWEKQRTRNEALDAAVLALAALRLLNPPLAAWRVRIAEAAGQVEPPADATTPAPPSAPKRTTTPRPRRVARSNYIDWR